MRNLHEFDIDACQTLADPQDTQCIPEIDADVLEVLTFPTDFDLLSLSRDPEPDLDEFSQSEDCAENLSGPGSSSGVPCAEKVVSVSVDLLEEDLALSDSDSDDDVTNDVSRWSNESVAASFLAATSGYSSDSESDSEDTVVTRPKSTTLPRRREGLETVSGDELSDDEGCDVTDRRRRRRRRFNRLEKERTDFTKPDNEGSFSPEAGTSQEDTNSSESESSDSSSSGSSDSESDDSISGSSCDSDSDSDDSTSWSFSDSELDSNDSTSGSSSDSDSGSSSCSTRSSSSSDDSDSGADEVEDAREIDLRFERNPCPATCVCRSRRNMLRVPSARKRRTEHSLYQEVLSRQLLKSYEAAREIDLRIAENPCPATCVCRSSRNMLQIIPTHRRETEPLLYRVVLSRRLLKPSNRIIHDCCEYRCSKRWQRPCRADLD